MEQDDVTGLQAAEDSSSQVADVTVAAVKGPATVVDGLEVFPGQRLFEAGAGDPCRRPEDQRGYS